MDKNIGSYTPHQVAHILGVILGGMVKTTELKVIRAIVEGIAADEDFWGYLQKVAETDFKVGE